MLKKVKLFMMVILIFISNIFVDFKFNTTQIEALSEGATYAGDYSTFKNYIRKWDYVNSNKEQKPARKYSVVSANNFNTVIESVAYCADANTEFAVANPILIASTTPPSGKYGIKDVWNAKQAKRNITQVEADMINLIVNYGYGFVDNKRGVNFNDEIYRAATQNLVWRYLLRKDRSSNAGNAYYGASGWSKDDNTASAFGFIPTPGNGTTQSTLKQCEKDIMSIVNEQMDYDFKFTKSSVTSDYIKYNEGQRNLILVESRTAVLHDDSKLLSSSKWYIENKDELENKGLVVSIGSDNNLNVKLKEGYGAKLGTNTKIVLSNVRDKDKAPANKQSMWLKSTNSQTLVVKQGVTDRNNKTVEISVEAGTGILLKKIDEKGNPLADAVFSYGVNLSGAQGDLTGYFNRRTAEDGIISDTRVWPANSTIKIKEIDAPEGYEVSSQIQQKKVEPGKILTFNTVQNIREPRIIKIIKKDDQNPGKPLQGVSFRFGTNLNGKENVDWFTKTTDANGEITFTTRTWYAGMKIYIKEMTTLNGYIMDPNVKEMTINKNDALNVANFVNARKTYPLIIKKTDGYTKKPLENATFWVSENSNFSTYDVYKTNVNGIAQTKNYPLNTIVYYKEVTPPDGYSGETTVKNKKVVIPADITKNVENTVTIENNLKPFKIRLFKHDEERLPISNATFEVYQQNADVDAVNWKKLDEKLITDSAGIAVSKNSYPMTPNYKYKLKEVVVPTGYKAISDDIQVPVTEKTLNKKDLILNTEVENEKISTIFSIHKFDNENKNTSLKGAKFSIIRVFDNKKVGELETDDRGNASTSDLLADVEYRLEETQAPIGYKITFKPEIFKLNSTNNYTKHYEIGNDSYHANIEIYKTDENGNPLNNVEFYIYQNATIVDKLVTHDEGDKKGYAKSKNLQFGVMYTIKEVNAPEGYIRNFNKNYTFNLAYEPKDEVMTYNVINQKQTGSIKITKYAPDGATKIGNVKFTVYNRITGSAIGTMTTDANGVATLSNLPVIDGKNNGYYRILEESAPAPYYVPNDKNMTEFELRATTDGTQPLTKTFTFQNPEITGNIALTKRDVDTNKPLSNIKFQLYKDNKSLSPTPIGSPQTTDVNGNVNFQNLAYGNYLIKETQGLSNYFTTDPKSTFYDKTTGYYKVTVNENGKTIQVDAYNKKRTYKVSLDKLDSSTNAPLANAVFNIIDVTDGNKILDVLVTDVNGKAESKVLEMPDSSHQVILKEITVPLGYSLSTRVETLSFDRSTESLSYVQDLAYVYRNTRLPSTAQLLKVDQYGNPIPGVTFQFVIYRVGTYTYKTDANGIIDFTNIIGNILYGSLSIEEMAIDNNYAGMNGLIELDNNLKFKNGLNGVNDQDFVNAEYDFATQNTKFTVKNYLKEANLTIKKVDSTNTSNYLAGAEYKITPLNGTAITMTTTGSSSGDVVKLPYATSYTVQEIKAPLGYEVDPNTYTYGIGDFNNVTTPTNGVVIGYKKEVTYKNTKQRFGQIHLVKQLRPAGVKLSGVTFDLYSVKDGKLTYIDKVTTGYFGDVNYPYSVASGYKEGLGKGDYFLVELDTTERNFTYDTSEVTKIDGKTGVPFSITDNDINNAVNNSSNIFKELSITNWEMKGNIHIRKEAENGDVISGAVFDVYKTETNGSDSLVETITTDSSGYAYVYNVDPGTYKVVEKYVSAPYKVDSTPQVKQVKGASISSSVPAVYTEFTFVNKKLKGNVTVQKLDATTKKPVAGVTFSLYEWMGSTAPSYDNIPSFEEWKYEEATTNADGIATFTDIPFSYRYGTAGYYLIFETGVPEGYEINKTASIFEIEAGRENFNFTYENKRSEGTVKIKKVDEKGNALGGAKFRITGDSILGEHIDYPIYTDPVEGIIDLQLPYGSYSVKEEAPPAGYVQTDFSSTSFTLSSSTPVYDAKYESPYVNTKTKYAIQVVKEDKTTKQRLKGAVFEVYEKDKNSSTGSPIAQGVTNDAGFCIVNIEQIGEYDIYEKTAPDGYKKIDGLIQRVQISEDTPTITLDTIENEPMPITLDVYKYDDEEGIQVLLQGAVFHIYDNKTNAFVMAMPATNNDGFTSVELPYGDYYVKEITAPDGYEQNTKKIDVTYQKKTDASGNIQYIADSLWVGNKKITTSSIKIKKYDKDDPTKMLENAVFAISNSKGEIVEDNLITGPDGMVTSKSLPYGSYIVKEVTPPTHYETDKEVNGDEKTYPVEVTSTSDKVILVSVANISKKQDIEIIKYDSSDESILLDGAQFKIFYDSECKNQVVGTDVVETVQGKATFANLPLGVYYIKEVKAPAGYQDEQAISWVDTRFQKEAIKVSNKKTPLEIENGQIKLQKVDKDDTSKKLDGAKFQITGPNGYNQTFDCNGELTIRDLAYGSYTITEIKAPEGYVKTEEDKVIDVTKSSSTEAIVVTFVNDKIYGSLSVKKLDSITKSPLANAIFEIYEYKDGARGILADTLMTDLEGKANSVKLAYGHYEVVEVNAPEGYLLSEGSKFVDIVATDSIVQVEPFENIPITGSAKILKVDENNQPIANVVFQLFDAQGQAMEGKQITTNAEGIGMMDGLPYGTYYFKEISAPEQYYVNEDNFPFKIENNLEVVILPTIMNVNVKGKISIKKIDVDTALSLGNATYGIYGNIDENNQVIGEPIDTVVTKEGEFVSNTMVLPTGIYYVKEILAPEHYRLNDEITKVEITRESNTQSLTLSNEHKKAGFKLKKVDKDTPSIGLSGAVFEVYNAEDYDQFIQSADETLELKPIGDSMITDVNGEAIYPSELLTNKNYVLLEKKAPDGYKLLTEPIRFTINDSQDNEIIQLPDIENEAFKGLIIYKHDVAGDPLPFARFKVYKMSGSVPTDGDVLIGEYDTDAFGLAQINVSTSGYGKYYAKETRAPSDEYALPNDVFYFDEITMDHPTSKISVENRFIASKVEVTKKDADTELNLGKGFKFNIYTKQSYENALETDSVADLDPIEMIETDERGIATSLSEFMIGDYVVKEVEAYPGYELSKEVQYITVQNNSPNIISLVFKNEQVKGHIKIQKTISGSLPDHPLPLINAKFNIVDKSGTIVDTLITDTNGLAESKELLYGIYSVVEISAPVGSLIPEVASKEVNIDGSQSSNGKIYVCEFENPAITSEIRIVKQDASNHAIKLPNAIFSILDENKVDIFNNLVTNEVGEVSSGVLPYGRYYIREIKSPDGYLPTKEDIAVDIKKNNEVITVAVDNFPTRNEVKLFKYDVDSQAGLENVVFQLFKKDADGKYQLLEDNLKTSADGVILKDTLEAGDYYYIEKEALVDYVKDTKQHHFHVGSGTAEDPLKMVPINIGNEKVKSNVTFEKTGDVVSGIEDKESIYPGLKEFVYTKGKIDNVVIGIYATAPLYLNQVYYEADDLIQELYSNSEGISLPKGKYKYKELQAPNGYLLDENEHEITIDDTDIASKNHVIEMTDIHTSVTLNMKKALENLEVGKENYYDDVIFGVYTKAVIDKMPADSLVKLITFDKSGNASWNGMLPEGEYYVKELATHPDYALSDIKYPLKIEYSLKPNQNQTIAINDGNIITNKKRTDLKLFEFYKIDQDAHDVFLKGAQFDLYYCMKQHTHSAFVDEECWSIYKSAISDVSGYVSFGDIPYGEYQLVESKAPTGYENVSGQWTVSIHADGITFKSNGVVPAFLKMNNKYMVTNSLKKDLPLSGGNGTVAYYFVGTTCIGLGWIATKKNKKAKKRGDLK